MNYNIYMPLLVSVNTMRLPVLPESGHSMKKATARTWNRRTVADVFMWSVPLLTATDFQLSQSLHLALINSRLRRAMLLSEMFLGHSAAHAPVLVQLPNPSSSILATMARARRARST